MKKKFWILIIIGTVVLSLIVGGIIGSQMFPKTKTIEVSPIGKFCYDDERVSKETYSSIQSSYKDMRSYKLCLENHLVGQSRAFRNLLNSCASRECNWVMVINIKIDEMNSALNNCRRNYG